MIYENLLELEESAADPLKRTGKVYGRFGNPTSRIFEKAISELEGGHDAICTSSGLAAITTAIMAFVKSGDHILVCDSVYYPTRRFCESLSVFGIETEYFDPRIGKEIETLIRPNTSFVFLESPGSMTYEIQDIPEITKICRRHNVRTLLDNTWGTPLHYRSFQHGIDVSIHSATKYISGHSEGLLGVIICSEASFRTVRESSIRLGQCASPDDVFGALRGLKTLAVRLTQHQKSARLVAEWLQTRSEIDEVLYPALEKSPDHKIWKRDFLGSNGLISVVLNQRFQKKDQDRFVSSLKNFGLGHSWGGHESLVVPIDPGAHRSHSHWKIKGLMLRFHIGLESPDQLINDLEKSLNELSLNF